MHNNTMPTQHNTMMSTSGPKCEWPTSAPRMRSTPYDNGSNAEIICNAFGDVSSGNSAPDRKKIGSTRKFITIGNACMSGMTEPIVVPKAAKRIAINNRKNSATGTPARLIGRNPAIKQTTDTSSPWNIDVVAEPSVPPIMISSRGPGPTSASFRKPNCRSHNNAMPENTDENSTAMPMIPGEMNCRYEPPFAFWYTAPRPKPRASRYSS